MPNSRYVTLIREAAINSDHIDGIDPTDPTDYEDSWLKYVEDELTTLSGHTDWQTLETNTDWESLAYNKDAQTKIFDLNISGGNDKTPFYTSGNYTNQDGILIGNFYERYSGRLNLDHQISDRLTLGVNFGISKSKVKRLGEDNAFTTPMQLVALAPISPVRDPDGNLYNTPVTSYYNGLIELEEVDRATESLRNFGNAFLDYKIIKNLTFRTELGMDIQNQTMNYWASPLSESGAGINGYGESQWYKSMNYNTNNYFTYKNIFNGVHDFNATLGMSFQEYTEEYVYVAGQDFPSSSLHNLASAGEITDGETTADKYNYLSYFARVNYKYKDRYLFNLSGRIDGSSRFGVDSKYGFFPAVSAGWILSEEDFWNSNSTFSFLKLRGSWGLTGNADGFGNHAHLGLYEGAKYNSQSVLVPNQLANPDLRWEKSNQIDIGIDFGFLNNRLTGELDYYNRKTKDLIYDVPVPGTSGYDIQTVNIGSMSNEGVELVLNSNNISKGSFRWSSSFNLAYNKNKLTKLDGATSMIPGNDGRFMNSLILGESIGVFYGPEYAGVDPENGDALFYKEDRTTTNDMDEAGNFIVGDPNPDFIGGFNNTFAYKGFDLSILLQGVFGNQILNGAGAFMSSGSDWFDNQTIDQLDRWQEPGDVTDIPQLRFYYGNSASASSRHIQNGDYVRLKNITFGYTLPTKTLQKLRIDNARIFVSGVNLLTFTKYTGWDPEVNSDFRDSNINQGSDFYSAPQIKSWTVGVNIGF
ncbi:SusC/RagA family TonB-linked outer membrane protein [Sphingobacterium hungaricum]|uniref:SusC/RagA family TonB-linked outer membrane protein n=1 Tax=Sphingobacterium hungaricum TaxID=2082723 RepID=A0A928UZ75_9SPHI|nr:SusC/RagA family TonB-linked outer membrane protein [Sphingobacterium hungaricum]